MHIKKGSCLNLLKLTCEEIEQYFQGYENFLFDCDGVLWLEGHPIEGSADVINRLRDKGKRIFLVTNNSRHTREDIALKASRLGFQAYEHEVICPSFLAVNYLKNIGFEKKVYLVAREGMAKEFDKAGIRHTDIGSDNVTDFDSLKDTDIDPEVGCVISGLDEYFTYKKMIKASTYLKDPNCIFLSTNPDEIFPSNNNLVYPGAGCILKSIETCTDRKAFLLGKPSSYIREVIENVFQLNPAKTIMVGDRGNTDIMLGHRCGFSTLMVMSGVTTHHNLKQWQESKNEADWEQLPDYFVPKLGDILKYLN